MTPAGCSLAAPGGAARTGKQVLTQYALERLLYRLSRSPHRERLILKGAMLFRVWTDQPHRPTRDLDLLGCGDPDVAAFERLFREVCSAEAIADGVVFRAESVRGELMKEDEAYPGVRLRLAAELGSARLTLHVDIGFGDAVVPAPTAVTYPTLLDLPAPLLRGYPRETVVAEKFEALVKLGLINSRMKDFYDLWTLARAFPFGGPTLARRGTALPEREPVALTAAFAADRQKRQQWAGFLNRTRLLVQPPDLEEVIVDLHRFLWPPAQAARDGSPFEYNWPPGGPWG
jgi:predicted nucleotidyltransferase component of viral defense system